MNIKAFFHSNRLFLSLIATLFLFSCTQNSASNPEAEESVSRVADIDLIKPVAMEAIGQTASALTLALSSTIDSAGVKDAIEYCNLNANDIVGEMAEKYGVEIKRTSLLLRNNANKPSEDEKIVLDFYANQESLGKDCDGKMSKVDGIYKYYHPIYVMENCTMCHGVKGDGLNKKAAKKIAELYPQDKALGYQASDLRGMWVVSFTK